MNGKENPVELLVICAVMLVLSILGIFGRAFVTASWES